MSTWRNCFFSLVFTPLDLGCFSGYCQAVWKIGICLANQARSRLLGSLLGCSGACKSGHIYWAGDRFLYSFLLLLGLWSVLSNGTAWFWVCCGEWGKGWVLSEPAVGPGGFSARLQIQLLLYPWLWRWAFSLFFGNHFIERWVTTYHTVLPFKVCNSVAFKISTELCNHHRKFYNIFFILSD